jgi:uncharacterized membrane protein YbhN (UPF0104 family)
MTRLVLAHVVALGLVAGDVWIRAVRLRLLLGREQTPGLRRAIAINAYGDAASALTPARIGGEPARFVALKRAGVTTPATVVVLAAERVIDLSLVGMVTVLSLSALGGRGFRDVDALFRRLAAPGMLPWALGVVALLLLGGAAAFLLRGRFPPVVEHSLRDALRETRRLAGGTVVAATGLTAASMVARVGILPVLFAAYVPITNPVPVLVGSFALIYAQLLLPTPGGVGGVELGFVASMAPVLSQQSLAALLLTWRVYSLFLPAGLGVALFGRGLLIGRRVGRGME